MNGKQVLLSQEKSYSDRFEGFLEDFCRKHSVSKAEVMEAILKAFKHGR